MKILFLLTASLDSPYGSGRCLPVACNLADLGHKITIVALHHDLSNCNNRAYQLPTSGPPIDVRYVGQMHVIKRGGTKIYLPFWKLIYFVLSGFFGLLSAGLLVPADVVHVGKPHPQNGMAGWLISRIRRLPLIIDCDDYEAEANRFSGRWQQKVVKLFEDWLPGQSKGVTVNTKFLLHRVIKFEAPAGNVRLVPNGTQDMNFSDNQNDPGIIALKEKLAPFQGAVIAYVGTLSLGSHPVDLLFDAFEIIYKKHPQSFLLLVGGGPDEIHLRTVAASKVYANNVFFTGQIDGRKIADYYLLADITVDPVYPNEVAQARCPLKLVESLKMGLPIVTGDIGDRKDLLGPDLSEWLVDAGSANALAAGILNTLEKKRQGNWPAAMIQARAKLFDWQSLAKKWERVYYQAHEQ